MIGANFEPLEAGITRVGWIRSDGSAYIDLDYAVTASTKWLEIEASFLTGTTAAPGCVFGTSQSGNVYALRLAADLVTYYKALNGKTLNQYYNNGEPALIDTINTGLYHGSIWTDTSGNVTGLTVVRRPLKRVGSSLSWDMSSGGVNAHYPLESLSGYTGHDMEILNDTTFRNNTLGYTQSVDMQTGTVTITSTAGSAQTITFQYVYPELREAYTQPENHQLETQLTESGSSALNSDSGAHYIDPATIINGYRHRIRTNGLGGYMDYGSGKYIVDRTYNVYSGGIYAPGWSFPTGSVFLFARNDGTLQATDVCPSVKVHGVKCLTIDGGTTYAPNAVCTRHLVAAVKAGVGAGLYDIINGKFYAARGGTMLYGGTQT